MKLLRFYKTYDFTKWLKMRFFKSWIVSGNG